MVTENGAQGDGNTSFLRAARAGNLERVLEHLKNNIDINTSNANGLNALHLASKDGHIHVVSELLRRGAIVDSATKKGNTALHIASLAGQEEVVKLLLEHNASVNVQSQNGFTPLYMAAQENHDAVVRLLLSNGANQSLATEDGFTPLAVAMQQGHDKVVAVLLESDTRGKVRLPALHIAAKKDDVKAATLLLDNDHNPDVTSKSGFTPLHIASHYGNQNIANLLIQKGADVNYSAKHNISPLHVAAKWGKTNMVSLLLEKGGNIEAKTRDGLTPLHCAARSGHEQVVDMLLERGAPISAKTKNGLAPLHMAAQGEHVDAARILLYHRAPVDEVTVDYLTALHVAAHCGHVRVAKLLLDRNADANARALNGFTPLHIACKKNRLKVVELLLRHGASISATTESGLTPLHVAAFMGCMNIVIYLLQHDASPDVPTVRGETPLHLAARANQTDIIRILLRNGAQVDARAREQQTPLHIASRLGNVDIVMLLLQHGAQVDATTKDMYTALHIAAKEGQDEVAAVLIENGAALDAATKKGFTPLHLTAKYGHIKVAQLLLQKEADVDAQGKNGVTPLHVACHYNNQAVALLLLEKGASPHATAKNGHTPLHIAARKNQMDIATTLLEYGAQANAESKAGFTPLHLSSQEGHAEISNLLIEHKAAVNHPAKNGLTPMHLCAQEDNVNVAEILQRNGANIDMATKAGYTPLHVASHFGQANMVRFLLQNGANIDMATKAGYTPLHQTAQQGHCHIVNLLLEHKANANAQTVNGQTPLHIARKLGYISVLDSLKSITKEDEAAAAAASSEEKYRVVAPEAMHESFMSDSEEEGGEDNMLSDQPYRYLTVDEMKSLGDDSLPIDVTRDERMDSNRMTQSGEYASCVPPTIGEELISPHKAQVYGNSPKATVDGVYIANGNEEPPHVGRKLSWKSFLVSFLVDARGGAMRGCRHSGVRMIIPSRSTCQPTRVTCRYVKPQRTMHPPQLMEGEALASRVLELGPCSTKFIGPVIMEVPHFASLRGKEREIIILRSDNGETWREHTIDNSEEVIHDVMQQCFEPEEIAQLEEQAGNHVCRFVTYDFPQYFAVVSRIRQEVHAIGPEGGMVSSTVVPQVQAVFPQGALTKKIKVGLQAQPVDPDLTAKLLGRGVAVSPIVTVEPRRRKFHKAITLSMPAPKAHSQGMINQYSGNTPTLRLLCSITGGPSRAQWEDVTGSTPLTFVNDCVSFTTTVSARFWLMDCRNISDATKMATELYKEVIHVPFIARFVVFAKKIEPFEARLRVFCMTDDREDKTLEKHELYTEVAKSRDVEVLEGKPQYIEMAGNLVPVTKSGDQLQLQFKAFRENRLPFTVRVKDQHADIVGRTLFMKEPKVAKGEPPQQPICILNIVLPEAVIPDSTTAFSERVSSAYRTSMFSLSKHQNDHYIGDIRIVDLSNLLGKDWIQLAPEIGITADEIDDIINHNTDSIARQAQSMIRLYKDKPNYDILALETALKNIGRDDIMKKCKSGRLSHSREFDEADLMKNSESVEELVRRESKRIQQINEREEVKYSAEEKEVEESESDEEPAKRTVAERREKIVKRLSVERSIPASTQKREITKEITEIKRKSLIEDKKAHHESEIMMQLPADNVIIKTAAVPEQVIKMKMGKMDSTEISKTEFDKELTQKLKTSGRSSEEEELPSPDKVDKIFQDISTAEKTAKKDTATTSRGITITRQEARDMTEDFLEYEKRTQLPAIETTVTVHEKFVEEVKEKTSPMATMPQETIREVEQVISEVTDTASKKVENIISSVESGKQEIKEKSSVLASEISTETTKVSETIKHLQDAQSLSTEQTTKTVQIVESTKIDEKIADFEAKKVKYDFHGGEPKTHIPKLVRKPSEEQIKPTAAPRAAAESEFDKPAETKPEKPQSKIPVKTGEAAKIPDVEARKLTQDFLQSEQKSQIPAQPAVAAEPKPAPAASKIPKVEPRKSVDKSVERDSKIFEEVVTSTATIMTSGMASELPKQQPEIVAKAETVTEKVTELIDTFHKIEEKVTKTEKTTEIASKVGEVAGKAEEPLITVQQELPKMSAKKDDKVAEKVAEVVDTFHKIEEKIILDPLKQTHDFLSMEQQSQLSSLPSAPERIIMSSQTLTASEPESVVSVKPAPPASKIPVVEPRKTQIDDITKTVEKQTQPKVEPLHERQLTADFLNMEQQTPLPTQPQKSAITELLAAAVSVESTILPEVLQPKLAAKEQTIIDKIETSTHMEPKTTILEPEPTVTAGDGIESAAPIGEVSPFSTRKLTAEFLAMEQETQLPKTAKIIGDTINEEGGLCPPLPIEPRKSLTDAEFCKYVGETITKKMSEGLIEMTDELKQIASDIPHSQTPPPTPSDAKTEKQNDQSDLGSLERDYLADTVTTLHSTTESTFERVSAISTVEGLTKTTFGPTILHTEKISQEIGDVKVGEGDEGEDLVARIREEAKILVEHVLEESVDYIESHGDQPNGHDSIKLEYNSDSENYAITCDDIVGVDVIKSPTIESMSGKSFDDNMSFTDEHINLPLHAQNITTTTSTGTVTTQFQQTAATTTTKETGGDLPISADTTPIPPSTVVTTTATSAEILVETNTLTTTSHDTPTPKPRVLKASPPDSVSDGTDSTTTIPSLVQQSELPIDISFDAATPVPKPRAPIKHTEQFENLAALGEQSDSISLRSLDFTEELSKTDEPSTELSIRSQLRDIVTTTTTTTTASEDHTESFEPTSEISVDEADTEKSEGAEKTTSFYIGESSRNVITKTSTRSPSMTPQDEEPATEMSIEAKDISLMKEISVDSDEANDAFKEYVTMKPDDAVSMDSKILRQSSETRNDILEFENADKDKSSDAKLSKVTTEESLTTSTGSSGRAIVEVAPYSSEDPDESSKEIPEIVNTIAEKPDKFELPLEKSEWEISEKEIPTAGKPKVVHSPQQPQASAEKSIIDSQLVSQPIAEVQESEELVKKEFELSKVTQAFTTEVEEDDLSSFIGIPEMQASTIDGTQPPDGLFDTTIKETLNKQAAMAHYAKDVFSQVERRDDHGSLGFVSTGTAEDFSSMEEHLAKEDQGSIGFISTETAEDFSSMEDYYTEKLATASVVAQRSVADSSSASAFEEAISDQSIKPVDFVVHRIKTDSSPDSTNRWSIPDVDNSSSSESYPKSFDKTHSRPLSSDVENLLTGTGTSSEYQTARDFTSTCRDGTEYISAVSTLGSSSGKSISSHESMRSLDSHSETSANLISIDVSELSETLVASSTEADALEAEEMARLHELRADDDDSDESLEMIASSYPVAELQTSMKRSQEMIFKPKSEFEAIPQSQSTETVQVEEYAKPKEIERTWGLAYPIEDKEGKIDSPRDSERGEDILLYHGDARRSIDESKLASSLDEGSILSVSMSSTSNIETVVENFDDIIGSAGSSSLTGIEGFQYTHDEQIPISSMPEDTTFVLEMESKDQSPQDSNASTPPGSESKRRGHKRSESTTISGDALKNLEKEGPAPGEGKESESESDTDPYESEYARQFRSPKERKNKKKKQAAAEMDHSLELEKRPFTPSQLVAEVIVEDATEEQEAEAAMIEERRPSQNMLNYSNIPDIMVTEDIKSPILEEEIDDFPEKNLYKVRTEEELNKAADAEVYQKAKAEEKELDFQRRVQEQYKQKLEELKRAEVGADYDDRAADSPDSFEMVEQPDISDEFVIIEEVAKEAGEVDLGGKSIKIAPIKYEQKHDQDVEKIIIKSAPADPKLGSQLYKDDLNFEFEESPPTGASSSSEQPEESDSSDTTAANKRWVEMQLTDTQLRYPYDLTGAVLEDIKEEDGEFEVGSSRISSFKDSFSSTPEYDLAARRYHSRGEHDDVSMSSLQEFESLEQAISLENRNRGHQGSTDSSNGSFTRRYMVRHSGSGTAPGDDVSISSLKDFEGLENACIEAHLIEIKAKEEAAMLSRSDESNKSNGSDKGAAGNVVVSKVTRTVTRTEVLPAAQADNLELLLKQQMEREDFDTKAVSGTVKMTDITTTELDSKSKIDSQDSEKDSIDSMEIRSHDMMTSSIESFDISKDATTRSDIDSLEIDKRHSRQESIESFGDEQMDLMSKFVSGGGVTLGDGLTTTTTTTTTSTDADGQEHTVTRVITTTTVSGGGGILDLPMDESGMSKDLSVDSLNMCMEQTTSSAGTTATYQTSAGNSQMSGSVTSCASSTLMEDSFPGVGGMSSSQMSASFWSHDESTVVEDENLRTQQQQQQQQQQPRQ